MSCMSNENKPLIGVIVPVYNSENTIKRCIESILRQTYSNFYVYIVNDGSTDMTNQRIAELPKDYRIHVINQANKGVSVARNTGIKNAQVDYLAFIDSDDCVEKKYLENLLKGYKNKNVDLTISEYKILKNRYVEDVQYPYLGMHTAEDIANIVLEKNGPKGYLWNKLWKSRLIKDNDIHFHEEIKLAEDLLFTMQYIEKCRKIIINDNKDYIYNLNIEGLSSALDFENKDCKAFQNYISVLKNIVFIFKKNNWKRDKICSILGIVSSRYLRLLNLSNSSETDQKKLLKQDCKKYKKYVFKDIKLPIKSKIVYLLSLYFPLVLSKIDRINMRTDYEVFK